MYKMNKKRMFSIVIVVLAIAVIAVGVLSFRINPACATKQKLTPVVTSESEILAVHDSTAESIYLITQEEINLIALVTMGEAEGETELGKRLVIDVILNRVDNPRFPNTIHDVIYQPNQFSVMWNGRIEQCCVKSEIVKLVEEELLERTNYDCVFFMAGGYSEYGKPMFQECCHYFSSY